MSDHANFQIETAPGSKIRVLHVTPCYYPATKWGGPIFSTKAICDEVAPMGDFHLRVLTTDTAGPERHQNLELENRTQTFPAGYEVHYAKRVYRNSTSPDMIKQLPAQMRWADVVHLTATYNAPTIPTLLLARMMGKPLVWSPRGALQATAEWDKAPNRMLKTALEYVFRLVRPSDSVLHVTAEIERDLSRQRIPGIDAAIISNSVAIPAPSAQPREWKKDGRVRLMFLSRVHEKKGIEGLLLALAQLPKHFELDIYGTGDSRYVAGLEKRVSDLGLDRRVRFRGHVEGEAKSAAFYDADIFILPTYSENFGIVVAEAMAHGVPTISTKGAPWSGLEPRGAGFWIDNTLSELASTITKLSEMDLAQVGANGRAWMEAEFSPKAMGLAFADLYRRLARKKT